MTLHIPGRFNIFLSFLAASVAVGLLWYVSHTTALWQKVGGAIIFSYVNNTLFSLLHESVHGVFHRSERTNTLFGQWLAAFFPTSFTLQRFFHLGHHRRNRSEAERFDYIAPGQNRWLKYIQWYGILTGLYWLMPPLACLIYFVSPRIFSSHFFQGKESEWSHVSGTDAMVGDIKRIPAFQARVEILFGAIWQAGLFWVLDLNFAGWMLCYGAFAVNWSSLQYADHAWSPLDRYKGAWDLRVNRVMQWVFLNYHHHRAHHENPTVPWIHLHRFVDWNGPRPSFLKIYLEMWKGPRPLPDQPSEGTR